MPSKLRFMQLDTFYSCYLDDFYRQDETLATSPYGQQIEALFYDGFAAVHTVAPYMAEVDYECEWIIANNRPLQEAWARENGYPPPGGDRWMHDIVREQIARFRPDVLYTTDSMTFDSSFMRTLSWRPGLIMGWQASDIPAGTDWSDYDIILSPLSALREAAITLGAKSAEHFYPGFPQWIHDAVKDTTPCLDVTFAGQWTTNQHSRRNDLLSHLAMNAAGERGGFSCGLYLSGQTESIPAHMDRYRLDGRFGIAMYRALRTGRIGLDARASHRCFSTVNGGQPFDIGRRETANMRIFETAGVGTFLLAEHHDNIPALFVPGREIETFSDEKEMIDKIGYYLAHPREREEIAANGRERCLKEHSMLKRTEALHRIIMKHLPTVESDAVAHAVPDLRGLPSKHLKADDDLANVHAAALVERFGNWVIQFRGLTISCHDLMSFYIAAKDIFIHKIYDFEADTARPVIVDGGGHIGLFVLYSKLKYPGAEITVFEPDKTSLPLLRKNIADNGLQGVTVVEAGLYSENGTLSFDEGKSDGSTIYTQSANTTITTVKLSDYIGPRLHFLKLNIEGAEHSVIREIEPKLPLVDTMVIEYHGFPETGQTLHDILKIMDRNGFRYLLHDFDAETNPATKPPFRIGADSRFFLLLFARRIAPPAVPRPDFGDLQGPEPISRVFGGDRMTDTSLPLCWYYIRRFLARHAADVAGRVLEIGDDTYTRMFGGGRVRQSDILHVQAGSPKATIIADLTKADNIPSATFDCIIFTQTLQFIYDTRAALASLYRILKPGGVLLASLPGISQISRYDMERWGEYWRFTTASAARLFGEFWPPDCLEIKAFGNVETSIAYLHGLVSGDLPEGALDHDDDDYQMMICVRAAKPLQTAEQAVPSESDDVKLIAGGWDKYARTWDGGAFSVISGHSVDYIGDEWTAEDVSAGGTNYGLDDDTARDFKAYLTRKLLDPYLPGFAGVGLEIGPGGGRVTELLKGRTGLLHVADASEAMLAKLKERFAGDSNLNYHFTDGMNLPALAAESLDYVLAFDVFVHFEPRLIFWYLRQIANLLKPGGTGIIHYANLTSPIGWQQFMGDLEMNVRQRTHFASFGTMSPEIMKTFLSSLGLEIVTTDTRLIPRDAVAVFRKPGPACGSSVKRQGTGHDPLVLIYHRIADLALDPQLLSVSPENFDHQLSVLAGNYRVIPLFQLIEECKHGIATPDTVALTFDDGYLDNLTNALPLLEKHGIHATIFPTVGKIGGDEEFWWDSLERIFLAGASLPDTLSINTPDGERRWELTSAKGRLTAYEDICKIIHSDPPEEVRESIDILLSWAGIPKTARMSHKLMSQEHLRRLAASPFIEIGSHGMNHTRLGLLPPARQRMEIRQSKQMLETIIGKQVRLFSYPYGSTCDYSQETIRVLAEEGYIAGIANIQGSLKGTTDLFSIPRRLVRNWTSRDFDTWLRNDDKDQLETATVALRHQAIINNMRNI